MQSKTKILVAGQEKNPPLLWQAMKMLLMRWVRDLRSVEASRLIFGLDVSIVYIQ